MRQLLQKLSDGSPFGHKSVITRMATALVVSLAVGTLGGISHVGRNNAVVAQESCANNDCEFHCNQSGDAWYGTDAQWLIVHAKPRLEGTSTDIRWQAASSSEWPILHVIADWEYNGTYISASMTIDEDGDCVTVSDPYNLIRCHKNNVSNPGLCDAYGGDWGKIGVGNCLSEVIYGFDFKQSHTISGKTFCWSAGYLTPDNNTGLYGRSASNCSSANLDWSNINDTDVFSCNTVDFERPGGNNAYDMDVYYYYDD